MTETRETYLDPRVAAATPWGSLRVVVVDTETTRHDGEHYAVSLAAVTCRAGRVTGAWSSLVDPGVSIGGRYTNIHGIADEHVAGEPTFIELIGRLLDTLDAEEGETVVLAAHNIGFDVGVLRAEMDRAGAQLPDIPVLDTMSTLTRLAGVRPADRSLVALLEQLGMTNPSPHDALADAQATAVALVELLNRAAAAGHTDIHELLNATMKGATTATVKARASVRSDGEDRTRPLLEAHIPAHAHPLPEDPTAEEWSAWEADIRACALLRCARLADRVQADQSPSGELIARMVVAACSAPSCPSSNRSRTGRPPSPCTPPISSATRAWAGAPTRTCAPTAAPTSPVRSTCGGSPWFASASPP